MSQSLRGRGSLTASVTSLFFVAVFLVFLLTTVLVFVLFSGRCFVLC